VLIGMPGCGKSAVGRRLAALTGRPFLDADDEVTRRAGRSPADIITQDGEDAFRRIESEVLSELGKGSGAVIATGGGCVTRRENLPALRRNSVVVWLRRDLSRLPSKGRPLSRRSTPEALYAARRPLYEAFADHTVENTGTVDDTARRIKEELSL